MKQFQLANKVPNYGNYINDKKNFTEKQQNQK